MLIKCLYIRFKSIVISSKGSSNCRTRIPRSSFQNQTFEQTDTLSPKPIAFFPSVPVSGCASCFAKERFVHRDLYFPDFFMARNPMTLTLTNHVKVAWSFDIKIKEAAFEFYSLFRASRWHSRPKRQWARGRQSQWIHHRRRPWRFRKHSWSWRWGRPSP